VSCTKTAELIEMQFAMWTRMGSRKHVLDGGAHWRHVANTTEPSMCGADAALCQITLTTCYSCLIRLFLDILRFCLSW